MDLGQGFLKPRYDRGGFASLPARIQELFALRKYDAVVMFLVDGFGWRFLERFGETPFLKRLREGGALEKLTSQFPSTTASHVTTIHTGLPVGQSGVYEWFYYEPEVDRVIAPLLFSFAGDKERDTLKSVGVEPRRLYPSSSLYPALNRNRVESYIFGVRDYTPSTYSNIIMQGATMYSFKTLPEALVNVGSLLETQRRPTYIHLYFDKIDSLCHEYGPASPQTEAEIEIFLVTMQHFFDRIYKAGKKVLFLMTADHGAAQVDPRSTIFLNVEKRFQGVEAFLRSNAMGDLLVPAGSPRDMFLYVREEMLEEAQAFLSQRLEGQAQVVRVSEMIEEGYFGEQISEAFLGRVGNLVILPHQGQSVWWYVRNKFEQRYYGHHGGLSPEEMEIPLFVWE